MFFEFLENVIFVKFKLLSLIEIVQEVSKK